MPTSPIRVCFVLGTRPEAIKLCPLINHMRRRADEFAPMVCATAQHRGLLDRALDVFGVQPDYDLDVMSENQSLAGLTARILERLDPVFDACKPDFVLVQGDTTTTFAASLACFYRRIPAGHVEAGLRTGDMRAPFPEELNRVLTSRLCTLHFAPTGESAACLRSEGIENERIFVTGNTGIDALLWVRDRLQSGELEGYDGATAEAGKRAILVTAHRRENFGEGFERICEALERIAARGDAEIVYPVHPNPNVRGVVEKRLAGKRGIRLIKPLDYVPFVDLMNRSELVLTDSGGIQEEGPSLGKPVLVMRDKTERPEAVQAGTARLVGTDPVRIVQEVFELLDNEEKRLSMTRVHNPFGDGRSSARISDAIYSFLRKSSSKKNAP